MTNGLYSLYTIHRKAYEGYIYPETNDKLMFFTSELELSKDRKALTLNDNISQSSPPIQRG